VVVGRWALAEKGKGFYCFKQYAFSLYKIFVFPFGLLMGTKEKCFKFLLGQGNKYDE